MSYTLMGLLHRNYNYDLQYSKPAGFDLVIQRERDATIADNSSLQLAMRTFLACNSIRLELIDAVLELKCQKGHIT
jgi:hypothetical protein